MRLIDADKLENEYNQYNYYLTYSDCLEELRKAPLVDAIPVEWIKKHIIDIRAEVDRLIEEEDYTNYELCDDANGMERLLEDWRKENESN